MDDMSPHVEERIRQALADGALDASPPPAYDQRVRRQAGWRTMAIMSGVLLAVAAVTASVVAVLPSESRQVPAAPASPDATTAPVSGELVFTDGGRSIQTVALPDGIAAEAAGGNVETISLEISPDGTLVAYAVGIGPYEGELRVLNLETGDSESIVSDEGTILSPAWTADGDRIAFISETYEQDPAVPIFRIGFVSPDGGDKHFVDEPATGADELDVSADGALVVYIDARSDVVSLSLDTGDRSILWSRKESGVADRVSLSPDGTQLAVVADGGLYLIPIDEPGALQPVETGLGIFDVAWIPGRQTLILSAEENLDDDADLYAFDLNSGSVSPLPSTPEDDFDPSIATSSVAG